MKEARVLLLAVVCVLAAAFGSGAATYAHLNDQETASVSASAGAFDLCRAGETTTYEFSRSTGRLQNTDGPDIITFSNYDYLATNGRRIAVDAVTFDSSEPIGSIRVTSRAGSTKTYGFDGTRARIDAQRNPSSAFVALTFTCAGSGAGSGGPQPNIAVDPASVDYGDVQTGSSNTQAVRVTNNGNAPLSVSGTRIAGADAGAFSVVSGGGSFTLAAGESRNVLVRFAPTSAGDKTATLQIDSNDPDTPTATAALSGAGRTATAFALNAGGADYTGTDGTQYRADTDYTGGGTARTGDAISGTDDDPIYQTERAGNFNYAIPLPNGQYQVTFKFAEFYFNSANRRVFGVTAEGQTVISKLDIYDQVGHDTALDITRTVTVTDGQLDLGFGQATRDQPKLSGLRIVQSNTASTQRNAGVNTVSNAATQNTTASATNTTTSTTSTSNMTTNTSDATSTTTNTANATNTSTTTDAPRDTANVLSTTPGVTDTQNTTTSTSNVTTSMPDATTNTTNTTSNTTNTSDLVFGAIPKVTHVNYG